MQENLEDLAQPAVVVNNVPIERVSKNSEGFSKETADKSTVRRSHSEKADILVNVLNAREVKIETAYV